MRVRAGRKGGFTHTASLLRDRIRKAGESRGFAVTRLLTHWTEIAGADIAEVSRPVNVSYGRQGFGATLTLLTTGPHAPMLEMQKETLRARVNAAYGYSAISRVRITQTAPTGFSDGAVAFEAKPAEETQPTPDPAVQHRASAVAKGVGDDDLRSALEALANNVLSKSKR